MRNENQNNNGLHHVKKMDTSKRTETTIAGEELENSTGGYVT